MNRSRSRSRSRSHGGSHNGGGGSGGGGGGGGPRPQQNNYNRSFDSTGPDIKIRGTANHVYEKYLQLARDASTSGDRVGAENYLQHAEHYYRIIQSLGPPPAPPQQQPQQVQGGQPQPQLQGPPQPNGDGNHGQQHQPGMQQQPYVPQVSGPQFGFGDQPGMQTAEEAEI